MLATAFLLPARAFPPAPDQIVTGMVRDELGVPVNRPNAEVWLEVGDRIVAKGAISAGWGAGTNYRLVVTLDSGITSLLTAPTALRPLVPFRLRVRIGSETLLPIEMTGASNLVTRPGTVSRVNLTLGVDSDGDGLPDAWERQLLEGQGRDGTLADVRGEGDSDGDGLPNLQEYLAGTYAFDPADGFNLSLVGMANGRPVLEFLAIRGRSYGIRASEDLSSWVPVRFNLESDPPGTAPSETLRPEDTRVLRPMVEASPAGPKQPRFFRLVVY